MRDHKRKYLYKLIFVILILQLGACGSVTNVTVNKSFPAVLSNPKEVTVAIVFTDEFSGYSGTPNNKTTIDLGSSQVNLFKSAFKGLFKDVYFLNEQTPLPSDTEMVISLSNAEVQVATPSENYLNVFEVWLKYNLNVTDSDGRLITNWFMPGYGKTPNAFMYSKENAISQATNVALRDAGAKLLLDFYRIPAVNQWLREKSSESKAQ